MTVQQLVGVPALVAAMRRDERQSGRGDAPAAQRHPRTQAARRAVPSVTEIPGRRPGEAGDPLRLIAVE